MASPRSTPRSLTQMLRDSHDGAVRDLLVARPDLGVPKPTTFSQIASRATTRESVRRVLDSLNALDLWVAQRASAFAGGLTAADIDGVDRETAAAALERLRGLALLWGDADALRPVRALATELGQAPLLPVPDVNPPSFGGALRQKPDRVDKVAAGSAFELVRRIEVLAERTDHTPIRLRQDGGLAQREARVVGSLLDLPVAIAVQHAQIAQAAGLIGVVPQGRTDTLLPTTDFDTWQELRLAEQWAWLARGWMTGHPPSGTATLKALCFRAFGAPGEGLVLEPSDIHRWLAWNVPRLLEESSRRATTMFAQAPWVGVTGLGALASFGLGEDLSALERLLPERAETVLVQNDLTAIAPGPLTPDAARELGALADVESRGGATVYRFTIESLRRAHSMGWSSGEITTVLTARSVTPIPQPLGYLIGDLDRTDTAATGTTHTQIGRTWSAIHRGVRASVTPLAGAGDGPTLDVETASEIVTELRRDAGPEARPEQSDLTAAEGMADSPLDTLREAVETGELVWLGYLDRRGEPGERLVYASAVEDGRVTARDSRTAERLSVPVHRVTAAHIIRGASV